MIIRIRGRTLAMGLVSALILHPGWTGAAALPHDIETVGTGQADPKLTNETQRRSTAREAALAEAQAKMLSILNSLPPDGKAKDQNGMQTRVLKEAEIIRTDWLADDQCRVILRLDKYRY